jgi:hypothetical protein
LDAKFFSHITKAFPKMNAQFVCSRLLLGSRLEILYELPLLSYGKKEDLKALLESVKYYSDRSENDDTIRCLLMILDILASVKNVEEKSRLHIEQAIKLINEMINLMFEH